MAWIEVHEELPRHDKVVILRRKLRITTPQAVGHLVMLWLNGMRLHEDGYYDLSRPEVVADAAGWDGEPQELVDALQYAGLMDPDGRIHNWDRYTGRLIECRRKDADRKRTSRGCPADVRRTSGGCPTDVQPPSGGCPTPHLLPTTYNLLPTTESHAVTVDGNETLGDPGKPDAPVGDNDPHDDERPARSQPEPPGFAEFWAAYPRKIGKGAAREWWRKRRPDKALRARILDAISCQRECPQWKKDGGAYIPHPATWLRQSRWEDEAIAPGELNGTGPPAPEAMREAALREKRAAAKRACRSFEEWYGVWPSEEDIEHRAEWMAIATRSRYKPIPGKPFDIEAKVHL